MKVDGFLSKGIYQPIIVQIDQICKANNVGDSHGLAHAIKIASQTQLALRYEKVDEEQYQNLIYAALLHDIDDHKYFKSANCANAAAILQAASLPQERISKIIDMINLVSFSKNGNTIKPQVPISYYLPRYVDRSEAIGIQGLHRSLMYTLERPNPSPIYCEETPKPSSQEQLQSLSLGRDAEYMKRGGCSISVVDHIFDKLMHIKLPQEIKNPYLVELYNRKHSEMVDYVLKHAKNGYKDYEKGLEEEYKLNGKKWETVQ